MDFTRIQIFHLNIDIHRVLTIGESIHVACQSQMLLTQSLDCSCINHLVMFVITIKEQHTSIFTSRTVRVIWDIGPTIFFWMLTISEISFPPPLGTTLNIIISASHIRGNGILAFHRRSRRTIRICMFRHSRTCCPIFTIGMLLFLRFSKIRIVPSPIVFRGSKRTEVILPNHLTGRHLTIITDTTYLIGNLECGRGKFIPIRSCHLISIFIFLCLPRIQSFR